MCVHVYLYINLFFMLYYFILALFKARSIQVESINIFGHSFKQYSAEWNVEKLNTKLTFKLNYVTNSLQLLPISTPVTII